MLHLRNGASVGDGVGETTGESVGALVGSSVGDVVGSRVGLVEGAPVGRLVGDVVGDCDATLRHTPSWHTPASGSVPLCTLKHCTPLIAELATVAHSNATATCGSDKW